MTTGDRASRGLLHHVELWVPDLARAERSWGWLLTRLGAQPYRSWEHGRSWRRGDVYVVVERSPDLAGSRHERRAPGLNHLAFHAGTAGELDALVAEAPEHGWRLLFPDRHPFAGGPDHRAAYLEDGDGFEVELVAVSS
ncbi:VOC family protein [Trujillonella humicola]|uniref:VOC family protein n=1 Tax=Trujillonella humicola TaxID=3383699 RepID=UPI0039066149